MKTMAQQLNVKDFPFIIKDKNENVIYYEVRDGYWFKREYDSSGRETYHESSTGYWHKRKHDSKGRAIYYENSNGEIIDDRSENDVITLNGIKYKRIDE